MKKEYEEAKKKGDVMKKGSTSHLTDRTAWENTFSRTVRVSSTAGGGLGKLAHAVQGSHGLVPFARNRRVHLSDLPFEIPGPVLPVMRISDAPAGPAGAQTEKSGEGTNELPQHGDRH